MGDKLTALGGAAIYSVPVGLEGLEGCKGLKGLETLRPYGRPSIDSLSLHQLTSSPAHRLTRPADSGMNCNAEALEGAFRNR